jgi:hypothetical protein
VAILDFMIANPKSLGSFLLLPALAVCVLAGCGGGSPEEEFAAEANSICAEFEEFSSGQEQLFREQVSSGDFEQAATTFEQYGEELDSSIARISSLERPAGEQASIERFISSSEELAGLVPGVVDALRESDTATLVSVATRLQELQKKADRAARASGLDQCAEAGPVTGST